MEDPSIIPTDNQRLRAEALPFVPQKSVEIPKKSALSTDAVPYVPMRQRIAFRDFALLLESLHMCKKDTGQVDRAFLLFNIFASLLSKEASASIANMLARIQNESLMIHAYQMKGSNRFMMHVCEFTMLVEELYGFMIRLNTILF
jgi:hypothetical protein